jgi:antitoxin MazE
MEKHLRTKNVKLIDIGNSKGIRIPKAILQKYGFSDYLLIDETDRGLLLRKKEGGELSWEHTYKQMAKEKENWDDFDVTLLDGLEGEGLGSKKI